jgi:cytochrome P450
MLPVTPRTADAPPRDLSTFCRLPLPLTVISEMLGVPEKDRMLFRSMMGRLAEDVGTTNLTSIPLLP